jgi:hypothetical protein
MVKSLIFPWASSGIEETCILVHGGFVLLQSTSLGASIQNCVIPDEAFFHKIVYIVALPTRLNE